VFSGRHCKPYRPDDPPDPELDKSSFWQKLEITPLHWHAHLRSMVKELFETQDDSAETPLH
jgi:dTDP-4-dehydrorhamnose reductase